MEDKIVFPESNEAAQLKTLTGWVSRDGRFFGNDEKLARYSGSTHRKCDCGNVIVRHRTMCEWCGYIKRRENYSKLTFQKWNGTDALCLYNDDQFFFSEDDLIDYCNDHQVNAQDLMLMICTPNYLHVIESDHWADIIPEEMDELPSAIQKKLDELNEIIKAQGPISWEMGPFKTSYEYNFEQE